MLVMIALPVMAVTAADVLMKTSTVSGAESIDRRMGAAEALVIVQRGIDHVEQTPDPEDNFGPSTGDRLSALLSAEEISSALGGARLLEIRSGGMEVRTAKGAVPVETTEVDLTDPLTQGLFDLQSGRWPTAPDEIVVNQALANKGYAVGEVLEQAEGRGSNGLTDPAPVIVGIAESTSLRDFAVAAGSIGSLGADAENSKAWLVDGPP
ncbi:hypothetical protein, partial [Nocardioides sp.]|uniref:hypothetical protein n=1 Tax=Nocardioides sp. TaxID=35761 RepID=UPI00356603BF